MTADATDGRTFEPLVCTFCWDPATTQVSYEKDWGIDSMLTCDDHKMTAFS